MSARRWARGGPPQVLHGVVDLTDQLLEDIASVAQKVTVDAGTLIHRPVLRATTVLRCGAAVPVVNASTRVLLTLHRV